MINMPKEAIGKELVLDIHNCNVKTFGRKSLEVFFIDLCKEIDMQRVQTHYWEYTEDKTKTKEDFEHLEGTSAVQFLKTSSIVCHDFMNLNKISINIFSCKDFNENKAQEFCKNYFQGEIKNSNTIIRY